MGLFSGIKNFFSSIGNAISSVLRDSPLMQKILPILALVIPPPLDIVAYVAIQAISSAMGVEENPDELGWQMNEADVKPEDFKSFAEYREYLNKEYPFDAEKYESLSRDQKSACRYLGLAGTMEELKQSKGFEITPTTLGILATGAASMKWDNPQIEAFAKGMAQSLSANGIQSLSPVEQLAKGTLAPEKQDATLSAIGAGLSTADVEQTVDEVREALQESVNEEV